MDEALSSPVEQMDRWRERKLSRVINKVGERAAGDDAFLELPRCATRATRATDGAGAE